MSWLAKGEGAVDEQEESEVVKEVSCIIGGMRMSMSMRMRMRMKIRTRIWRKMTTRVGVVKKGESVGGEEGKGAEEECG